MNTNKNIKNLEFSQQQMRLGNLPSYDQQHYIAVENMLSEFEQLVNVAIDTVFSRNNFETEALARKLLELGYINKEGNLYVCHKKLEKEGE